MQSGEFWGSFRVKQNHHAGLTVGCLLIEQLSKNPISGHAIKISKYTKKEISNSTNQCSICARARVSTKLLLAQKLTATRVRKPFTLVYRSLCFSRKQCHGPGWSSSCLPKKGGSMDPLDPWLDPPLFRACSDLDSSWIFVTIYTPSPTL